MRRSTCLAASKNNAYTSKDYGVDLSPKIMFAQLDLLALLVQLKVYKYLEFQSVLNFHVFENDHFKSKLSNTTKEEIFTDQLMSLTTKRLLMKFLKFVLQDNADADKVELLAAHSQTPIDAFLLLQFNLHLPQADELIYSIGLCTRRTHAHPSYCTQNVSSYRSTSTVIFP